MGRKGVIMKSLIDITDLDTGEIDGLIADSSIS